LRRAWPSIRRTCGSIFESLASFVLAILPPKGFRLRLASDRVERCDGFGTATKFGVGTSPQDLINADFNGDGKPDLATANPGSDNVSVLLGDGSGNFGAAKNFATGKTPRHLTKADFNRDGKLDLAVSNDGSDNISVLLGKDYGGFGAPKDFNGGSNGNGIASASINSDARPDLAVANGSEASVLINISKKKRR
jgi:hypothetical protein